MLTNIMNTNLRFLVVGSILINIGTQTDGDPADGGKEGKSETAS